MRKLLALLLVVLLLVVLIVGALPASADNGHGWNQPIPGQGSGSGAQPGEPGWSIVPGQGGTGP